MRNKRVMAAAAAFILAGLGSVSCTSSGGGTAEAGELRLGVVEPDSLLPGDAEGTEASAFFQRLYVGLYTYSPDGSLEPVIAETEPQSEDNKTWTIKLSDGWKFHNGEKITAETFVDAWNFAADGANSNAAAKRFSKIKGFDDVEGEEPAKQAMSGLKAKDASTLEITLTEKFTGFPSVLGHAAFAPIATACLDDIKACKAEPIGNGPYKIDKKNKDSIALEKWKGFPGEKPKTDKTLIKFYSGDETAWPDFEDGSIDIADIPAQAYEQAKQDYGDEIIQGKTASVWGLGFPVYDKDYKDPKVRRALSMALDRDSYVKDTFDNRHEVANSWTPPIIPGFKADTCGETCTFNQENAKELLDETDFPQDEKITLWTVSGPGEDYLDKIGDMLKRNLGLEYELKSQDWEELEQRKLDHELTGPVLTGTQPGYPLNASYLTPYTRGFDDDYFGYRNKKFDRLLNKGDVAKDLDSAIDKYQAAEQLLAKNPPVVPIWVASTATVLDGRIDSNSYDPNPIVGGFDPCKVKLAE